MRLPRPISEGWALLAPLGLAALALRRRRRARLGGLAPGAADAAARRHPERPPPTGDAALAPADGRVVRVGTVRDERFEEPMLEIAIFLALWHVHVQRAPLAGRVVAVERFEGKFGNALFGGSEENYRQAIYLETDWGPCSVTQVAGMLARRIVRWVEAGQTVAAGQRLGMIKFGSRVVLRLPAGSEPLVRVGQEIRAGVTPVASRQRSAVSDQSRPHPGGVGKADS
jgi:phosphatidylserine decarboxylase